MAATANEKTPKGRKQARRVTKLTNTHLKGIDLTKDYVPKQQ